MSKKTKTVAVVVDDDISDQARYVVGQVVMPYAQSFQDAPNGMQLQQQYVYHANARYQWRAREVGKDWVNVGDPFSYPTEITYGAQLIMKDQIARELIFLGYN